MNKDGLFYQADNGSTYDEVLIAKLAFIGSLLATIGDGITTISAAMALENLANSNAKSSGNGNSSGNDSNRGNDLEKMQQQLDALTKEMAQMKRSSNPRRW
ncbi:hypothetical protein NCCP2222_23300 [Sporosarcina sp. NCCP-2222]|uniref:translation initiation factor 2 n=1 Tax=Sporosarcina sp. NCCP-2222 TaxID=2935073 RepID=UPI00208D936A|nr:translation initiation factor 2 [Sporosarcina sp. NCCP-2222]GKV56383.1 hypothetical protein NCCP2222_23300 [Sporosarcina sp. NCCP-2222]